VTGELFREPGLVLSRVPAADLTLLVVAAGAVLAVVLGLLRDPRPVARHTPILLALLGGTGAVAIGSYGGLRSFWLQAAVTLAVAALLVAHLALRPREESAEREAAGSGGPAPAGGGLPAAGSLGVLVAALLVAAALLLWHLGTFAGSTMVWESPVTAGFGDAFYEGTRPLEYAVRTLPWNDGLVSNGNLSLLYGAPTYALLTHLGFSPFTLRACAALAALLLVAALWLFASRHYGAAVAAGVAVLAALNPYVIFYGKYGTSLAATLLACALAALAVGELGRRGGVAWWHGLVAALALYVATTNYSPARLVVIVLLASAAPWAATAWREHRRRALAAFATLGVAAAAVVAAQGAVGAAHLFLHARGEQIFTILGERDYVREYLARESPAYDAFERWAGRLGLLHTAAEAQGAGPDRPAGDRITTAQRVEVTFKVLAETLPECNRLLSPFEPVESNGAPIFEDPPPIKPYFAPLAAFTLLGFAISLRRLTRWCNAVMLAWFTMTVVPVLLTTRLDAHRTFLVAVPLCFWTAQGVVEAGAVLRTLGVGRWTRTGLGVALAAVVLWGTGSIVLRRDSDSGIDRRVLAEVERIPGPLAVGALIDHRERAWLELALLERTRRNRSAEARLLPADLREVPARERGLLSPELLERFRSLSAATTVILAPADPYRAAAGQMRAAGLRVDEVRDQGVPMWVIRGAHGR
jgi:hypothetical protein